MQEEKDINNIPIVNFNLYHLEFTSGKDSIDGILLDKSDNWSLLKFVPVDYQLDGFVIVNNNHIKSWKRDEAEIFKEKVIKSKNIELKNFPKINLSNPKSIFQSLNEHELIQLEVYKNDVTYIGRVEEIKDNSLDMKLISVRTKWLESTNFLYKNLWMIYFDNDYLNSLMNYIRAVEPLQD